VKLITIFILFSTLALIFSVQAQAYEPKSLKEKVLSFIVQYLTNGDAKFLRNTLTTLPGELQEELKQLLFKKNQNLLLNLFSIILRGHHGRINSVAFSPNGEYLLTGSDDTRAILWDIRDLDKIRACILKGHTQKVELVAFSPDSKYALTSSADGIAIRWDITNPNAITCISSKYFSNLGGYGVKSVALSPDGTCILGSESLHFSTALLWDIVNRRDITSLRGHTDGVTAVAFSPDGKYALTGSNDTIAILWDLKNIQPYPLIGHNRRINAVAFSPNGKYVLTGSLDKTAILWDIRDINNITAVHRLKAQKGRAVGAVIFSLDSKRALTGSFGNRALLWDITNIENIISMPLVSHDCIDIAIALSPDGKYALTGSKDKTATLWDIADIKNITSQPVIGHTSNVGAVAFSPDSKYALTGSRDKTARLLDLKPQFTLEQLVLVAHLNRLKENREDLQSSLTSNDYQEMLSSFSMRQQEALKNYFNFEDSSPFLHVRKKMKVSSAFDKI
jgi:WD40 repeat protein